MKRLFALALVTPRVDLSHRRVGQGRHALNELGTVVRSLLAKAVSAINCAVKCHRLSKGREPPSR